MPKTRFLTWYRLIPLAAVFAFGLISFVYSYAPAAFFKPLYPIDYEAYVKQSSISHNLDPYLVCAVIKSESNWDPGAESNQGHESSCSKSELSPEALSITVVARLHSADSSGWQAERASKSDGSMPR